MCKFYPVYLTRTMRMYVVIVWEGSPIWECILNVVVVMKKVLVVMNVLKMLHKVVAVV